MGSRSKNATAPGDADSFGWSTTYVQVQLCGFPQGVVNGGKDVVVEAELARVRSEELVDTIGVAVGWVDEGPGPGWGDAILR